MKKILVVDDQRIHREYMEEVIMKTRRYELLPSLTDAETAVSMCRQRHVDMVLMDIHTGGRFDGIEAGALIMRDHPDVLILIVTSMIDSDYLTRAREAGAAGLWYKDESPERLADVIDRIFEGERIFPDEPPIVRIGAISSDELTPSEVKVLRLIVEGYEYDEIGEELGLKLSTVKWHVSNILHKTGFPNRTRLAVAVSQKKFIVPSSVELE